MRKCRWAVLISGRGSNLATFLDSQDEVQLALVISNKAEAYGLQRARRMGIPCEVIEGKANWQQVQATLKHHRIDAIFLCGFMKIIPEEFLEFWQGRIFNIHPSLLPAFTGLKSIERAVEAEADVGATVHGVIPEVDRGEIFLQKEAVNKSNLKILSIEKINFYVHVVEHELVRKWVRHWQSNMTFSS